MNQNEFRNLRYNILEKKCKEMNIKHILVAHQFEDRVETLFMRLIRFSGITGFNF